MAPIRGLGASIYFYPRPPRGGRLAGYIGNGICRAFLSTPSARRATFQCRRRIVPNVISIHALREGGRLVLVLLRMEATTFLSTPSARRATWHQYGASVHQSISIHALREEGDYTWKSYTVPPKYFYPRPPRGGRQAGQSLRRGTDGFLSTLSARRATRHRIRNRTMPLQFLSTPSARRATTGLPHTLSLPCHFYPRPPRGGRRLDRWRA